MNLISRFSPAQGIALIVVIAVVLFFGGFLIARSTAASMPKTERESSRYQFLQVGDTVAAIDVYTGEAYAIDGNTRAWTLLAPALPARGENKPTK
jgi:hypothetical protein